MEGNELQKLRRWELVVNALLIVFVLLVLTRLT